jgi:hypothetical protein
MRGIDMLRCAAEVVFDANYSQGASLQKTRASRLKLSRFCALLLRSALASNYASMRTKYHHQQQQQQSYAYAMYVYNAERQSMQLHSSMILQ